MRLQPLPARVDNYIWVLRNDQGRALVVDPSEAAPVFEAANSEDFSPAAILLTHHHADHVAGAAPLLDRWTGTPVYGPDDDRVGLPVNASRAARRAGRCSPFRRRCGADGELVGEARSTATRDPGLLRARVHAGQCRIRGGG